MAHRISDMRKLLTDKLHDTPTKRACTCLLLRYGLMPHDFTALSWPPAGDWSHIQAQIGMFCYTGLSAPQVQTLVKDHHIYMTADGRISMAGTCASC